MPCPTIKKTERDERCHDPRGARPGEGHIPANPSDAEREVAGRQAPAVPAIKGIAAQDKETYC